MEVCRCVEVLHPCPKNALDTFSVLDKSGCLMVPASPAAVRFMWYMLFQCPRSASVVICSLFWSTCSTTHPFTFASAICCERKCTRYRSSSRYRYAFFSRHSWSDRALCDTIRCLCGFNFCYFRWSFIYKNFCLQIVSVEFHNFYHSACLHCVTKKAENCLCD